MRSRVRLQSEVDGNPQNRHTCPVQPARKVVSWCFESFTESYRARPITSTMGRRRNEHGDTVGLARERRGECHYCRQLHTNLQPGSDSFTSECCAELAEGG